MSYKRQYSIYYCEKNNLQNINQRYEFNDRDIKEEFIYYDVNSTQTIRNLKEFFISIFGHIYNKPCICQLFLGRVEKNLFGAHNLYILNQSDTKKLREINQTELYLIKNNNICNCVIKDSYNDYIDMSKFNLIKEVIELKNINKEIIQQYENLNKNKESEINVLKKNNDDLENLNIRLSKLNEIDNLNPEDFYDVVIDINSIKDIKKGWKIKMSEKGKNNYEKYKNEDLLRIGVIGNSKVGKSFLLSKISKIKLIIGSNIQTDGLSIIYPYTEYNKNRHIIILDSTGLEKPLLNDNIKQEKENINLEENNDLFEEKEKEEDKGLKERIKDKKLTELFLQNFIIKNSDILLLVVGHLTYSEQLLINKIKEECKNKEKDRLIIVHNLKTLRKKEHIEQYINNILINSSTFHLIKKRFIDIKENENKKEDEIEENKNDIINLKNNDDELNLLKENNNSLINKEEEENINSIKSFMIEEDQKKENIKKKDDEKEDMKKEQNEREDIKIVEDKKVIKIKDKKKKNQNNIINENDNDNNNNNIEQNEENDIDKNIHFCEVLYYDNNKKIDVYHLIIANEDSEAGKYYNEYTYKFIENLFNTITEIKKFDVFEEIKNEFKEMIPNILNKKIDKISFNKNEDIINNKIIKLELEEDLSLEKYFLDEELLSLNTKIFKPKYNYFKPDDKTLEIRLEIPGNAKCNIERMIEKNFYKLKVTGIKKPDTSPKNPDDNIINIRQFTDFEFIISLPKEEFQSISEKPKEGYPKSVNGLYITQFDLTSKEKDIPFEIDGV